MAPDLPGISRNTEQMCCGENGCCTHGLLCCFSDGCACCKMAASRLGDKKSYKVVVKKYKQLMTSPNALYQQMEDWRFNPDSQLYFPTKEDYAAADIVAKKEVDRNNSGKDIGDVEDQMHRLLESVVKLQYVVVTGFTQDSDWEKRRYNFVEMQDTELKESLRYSPPGCFGNFNTACRTYTCGLWPLGAKKPFIPGKDIDKDPELRYGADPDDLGNMQGESRGAHTPPHICVTSGRQAARGVYVLRLAAHV